MSAGPIRTLPIDARISYSASGLQDHCADAVTPLVHFVVWRNSIPVHEVQMHAHHARQLAAFLLAAADDADGVAIPPARSVDDLMELARQYAHAYFNHYSGTKDGMLDKTREALRAALTPGVAIPQPPKEPR